MPDFFGCYLLQSRSMPLKTYVGCVVHSICLLFVRRALSKLAPYAGLRPTRYSELGSTMERLLMVHNGRKRAHIYLLDLLMAPEVPSGHAAAGAAGLQ